VGLGRQRDKQCSPDAHPLRQQEGPAACRRIQWVESRPIQMPKASQMTARDENGEHQRPAAKIMIEVHRMSTAAASTLSHTGRARLRAEALLPTSCP